MGRRSLHARIGGEVILQSYEPSRGWHAQIESLRAPLLATAADVLNTFVRITSTDVLSRQAAKDQPPGAPMSGLLGSWSWSIAHLEGDYVPDAYGQQVITTNELRRAHDLSPERWIVEDLGHDQHLVIAQELGAWFDTDCSPYQVGDDRYRNPAIPSPTTLTQARADYGEPS